MTFREDEISQIPALSLLQKLGYRYIPPEEIEGQREGKRKRVILESVLKEELGQAQASFLMNVLHQT